MTRQDSNNVPGGAPDPLVIRVTAGSGTGRTTLAAFDAALRSAGVADHNLIRLSSIVPPGAVVEVSPAHDQLRGEFGDKLYCVYAVSFATEVDEETWAGVGWSRSRDGDGRGLFVEHVGHAEAHVRNLILTTLGDMNEGRDRAYEVENMVLSSARCEKQPVCALVIATYRTEGWTDRG